MFGRAVLRPLRPNDVRPLNFEIMTSKICNHFRKFACQAQKGKADLCMTNSTKLLIFLIFFLRITIILILYDYITDKYIEADVLTFVAHSPNEVSLSSESILGHLFGLCLRGSIGVRGV